MCTFPSAYGRSILTVPWVELGGPVTINCQQTGYSANIEFQTKVCLLCLFPLITNTVNIRFWQVQLGQNPIEAGHLLIPEWFSMLGLIS